MSRVILLCVSSFLSFSLQILAQSHIAFNHLNVENGLSQSSTTCILQDKNGFMWFGTQDGLNRYDGYNFKVFKNNPDDTTSLSDNFIFSIFEDESGSLFIETQSGKINKYNPFNESFKIVSRNDINLHKAKINSVLAVYFDKSDVIWTGGLSKETGLKMENKRTGETQVYRHSPSDKFSLSDNKVYSVMRDSKGSLWVGTVNGLDKLDEKTGKFQHFKNIAGDPNSLSDNWVWPIFEDSKGNLWI